MIVFIYQINLQYLCTYRVQQRTIIETKKMLIFLDTHTCNRFDLKNTKKLQTIIRFRISNSYSLLNLLPKSGNKKNTVLFFSCRLLSTDFFKYDVSRAIVDNRSSCSVYELSNTIVALW